MYNKYTTKSKPNNTYTLAHGPINNNSHFRNDSHFSTWAASIIHNNTNIFAGWMKAILQTNKMGITR